MVKIKVNMVPSEYHGVVGYKRGKFFITKWIREKFNG